MYPLFFDPTYIIIIPALIFAFWAQSQVSGTFERYSRLPASSGLSAAAVAADILRRSGLNVPVERIAGQLTDHYDPRSRVLRLSSPVYDSYSVAALGVAAHEVGHALQHEEGYVPLTLRNSIVPLAQFGSMAAWPLFIIGLILSFKPLITLGILFFAGAVLFQVITLPVEYNASARGLALLESGGYLTREELIPTRKVLQAAALTYVAATAMAIAQLLRLLILSGMFGRRDD